MSISELFSELFDTSNSSIIVSILLFLIIVFVSRYLFNKRAENEEKEQDTTEIIGYSILIGLLISLFIMFMYKRSLVYIGSKTYNNEDFEKKGLHSAL